MKKLAAILMLTGFASLAAAQSLVIQRGTDRFPMRDLPNGTRSVQIDGRTYILVTKDDLAVMSAETEVLRASGTRNDTLLSKLTEILHQYEHFEESSASLVRKQADQIAQSEKISAAYREVYQELKSMAGISSWSILGGVGLQTFDSETKILYALGVEYRHWHAQYQVGSHYNGMIVGFRLSL
jgi:hypothetical protein